MGAGLLFDGERRVPCAGPAADGHAHDTPAVYELCGVLHAVDAPDARQAQGFRVAVDEPEAPGRVREPRDARPLRLVFRPAHPTPAAPALAAVRPVPQRLGKPFEGAVVRLLAVLPPPWGDLVLPFVPPAAHGVHRPVRPFAEGQLPANTGEHEVVREPGGPRMACKHPLLPGRGVEPDLDGLIRGHRVSPPTLVPRDAWRSGARTGGRRTRSAPRSCRAPDRHPAPCRPPR